jgi:hypothetical protein
MMETDSNQNNKIWNAWKRSMGVWAKDTLIGRMGDALGLPLASGRQRNEQRGKRSSGLGDCRESFGTPEIFD